MKCNWIFLICHDFCLFTLRGRGLWPILPPTTRGRSNCFGFMMCAENNIQNTPLEKEKWFENWCEPSCSAKYLWFDFFTVYLQFKIICARISKACKAKVCIHKTTKYCIDVLSEHNSPTVCRESNIITTTK